MYLGNDRSISIAFPNPVVLQSGDSVVLAVWYNQAFPRDASFNGNLEVGLNAVMNYSINFK